MPSRDLDFPIFDADNHMYETEEALTKFLPKQYAKAIEYIDIRGRTKIVVRGTISEYIPNPTFAVVAAPGCPGGVLPSRESRREVLPRADRRPHQVPARLPRAGPPPRADGRAGDRPGADVPHPGQPHRGAAEG